MSPTCALIFALLLVPLAPTGQALLQEVEDRVLETSPTADDSDPDPIAMILRLEGYVRSLEDPTYGYTPGTGYPMYLFNFGLLYRGLYLLTGEDRHLDKLVRAADIASSRMRPDGTWQAWNSTWNLVAYNWQAIELFIDAWRFSADSRYLGLAGRAARGALNATDLNMPGSTYDQHFLIAAAWAHYARSTGDRDPTLLAEGRRQLAYAFGGLDDVSGRWFYNPAERAASYYDGHSAYYQFGLLTVMYYWYQAFISAYPAETFHILASVRSQHQVTTSFLLPSGTWYYSPEAPDYTEGAADALLGHAVIEREARLDPRDGPARALVTLQARQSASGGFYKSANTTTVDPWFTDNVAASLPAYVDLVATPAEKADHVGNMVRAVHLRPGTGQRLAELVAAVEWLAVAPAGRETRDAYVEAAELIRELSRAEFRGWIFDLVGKVREQPMREPSPGPPGKFPPVPPEG